MSSTAEPSVPLASTACWSQKLMVRAARRACPGGTRGLRTQRVQHRSTCRSCQVWLLRCACARERRGCRVLGIGGGRSCGTRCVTFAVPRATRRGSTGSFLQWYEPSCSRRGAPAGARRRARETSLTRTTRGPTLLEIPTLLAIALYELAWNSCYRSAHLSEPSTTGCQAGQCLVRLVFPGSSY